MRESFPYTELSLLHLRPVAVTYCSCIICGLTTKHPLPNKQELRSYYRDAWHSGGRSHAESMDWLQRTLSPHTRYVGKVLDVGSRGTSMFDRLGISFESARGLDPAQGHDWLEDGLDGKEAYDLVTCFHTLEHSFDPTAFLRDLDSYVSPGGYIFLEVPSLEAGASLMPVDDLSTTHNWHFSIPSLISLCSRWTILAADSCSGVRAENRILCRKGGVDGRPLSRGVRDIIGRAYAQAWRKLSKYDPESTGLYGASVAYQTLLCLHPEASRFRVFDLYKADSDFCGIRVEHPNKMNVETLLITPRQAQSVSDITSWLKRAHPYKKAISLW